MGKKVRRVKVQLDSKNISHLLQKEIQQILRGADELIGTGGRNLLSKLLKGSKAKEVLDHDLNKTPVYGCLGHLKIEDITARIDWLIENDFLGIEYDYQLPLLVHTYKGWQIVKNIRIIEFMQEFGQIIKSGKRPYDMSYLKDKNREMIFKLLDTVLASNDTRYIPLLKAWAKIDYKKVNQKIRSVITDLEKNR